jgi:hypothetical protein
MNAVFPGGEAAFCFFKQSANSPIHIFAARIDMGEIPITADAALKKAPTA